jgi:hypothetical protein
MRVAYFQCNQMQQMLSQMTLNTSSYLLVCVNFFILFNQTVLFIPRIINNISFMTTASIEYNKVTITKWVHVIRYKQIQCTANQMLLYIFSDHFYYYRPEVGDISCLFHLHPSRKCIKSCFKYII